MKKLLLVIMLLFIGCSSKVSEVFQKDDKYIILTQYTQRGQITRSLETIAIINATYINPILKDNNETKNNEIFIIGVYNSNDYKGYEKGGIHNPHYNLTMNGMKYTKAIKADVKKLDKVDIVYQDAFSPKVNTILWTIEYFRDIDRLSPKIITTYSVATPVRYALYSLGYNIYTHPYNNIRKGTLASKEILDFPDGNFLEKLKRVTPFYYEDEKI